MVSLLFKISWRLKGLRSPSFSTRSTFRLKICSSSSCMVTMSHKLQLDSGVKLTKTSTSLSGMKSSRITEPKRENSLIFHCTPKYSHWPPKPFIRLTQKPLSWQAASGPPRAPTASKRNFFPIPTTRSENTSMSSTST